jgi:hypothetical protein
MSDIALRDRLIAECRTADATVHQVAQSAIDLLMVTIIAATANVDDAECEIRLRNCSLKSFAP